MRMTDLIELIAENAGGQASRRYIRRLYRRLLYGMANEIKKEDLQRSAVVFSPHFDDETLGCGGTIIRKKNAGANVTIVFMTDGSKSHSDYVSENELKKIRVDESIAAARALGLEACNVVMLGFEETKLMEHARPATQRVVELIHEQQPLDIFVPYHEDPQNDHLATNRIVKAALLRHTKHVTLYEYPVWYWQQWPWVSVRHQRRRQILKEAVLSGLRFVGEFRTRVSIADHLVDKRAALEQYRSQMTRLNSSPSWPILGDVSNGEFLECFLQDYELFSKRLFFYGRRPRSAWMSDVH